MPRVTRTPLVVLLLVGLVFSSLWQILYVQKAKAVTPPRPADYTLTITSTDTLYATVRINATTGAGAPGREFMFTMESYPGGTRNFSSQSDLPSYSGRRANDNDVIKIYQLTTPSNLYCQSGANRLDIYMIAVKYTGIDELYHFAGIYSSPITIPAGGDQTRFFNRIPDAGFGWGTMCNNIHNSDPVAEAIIKRANSSEYTNAVVLLQISEGDRVTRCNSLERRWEEFKTAVRQLMEATGPIALQAPASQTTQNPYWSQSVDVDVKWINLGIEIGHLFTSENSVFDNTYNLTVDLNLTVAGKAKVTEIANLVEMMRTDFAVLKAAYPGNTWPDGCVRLKVFKWDPNFPNPATYTNLDAFNTDLEKAYNTFKNFIAIIDEPISTGDEGACGKMGYSFGRKMWYVLLCNMGDLLHLIAGSLMTKATEYLQASIGIDAVKFEPPAKVSEDGGNAPTGGTPAPTPTPTPGTETFAFDKTLTFTPSETCTAANITAIRAAGLATIRVRLLYGPSSSTVIDGAARSVTASGSGYSARIVAQTAPPAGGYNVDMTIGNPPQGCMAHFTN